MSLLRTLGAFRPGFAVSCFGLLAAAGCVSKQQFSQVDQERRRLAADLVQQQAIGTAAREACNNLTAQLQATAGEADENGVRAVETDAELAQSRASIVSIEQAAHQQQAELQTVLQNLATAEKSGAETRSRLLETRGELAAKEAALQDTTRTMTAAAQKQQAELETARRERAELDRANTAATAQLSKAQQQIVELSARADGLAAAVAKFKLESDKQIAGMATELRDAQAAIASTREDAQAARTQLQATRERLTAAEQARDEAAKKLTESEKSMAALKAQAAKQTTAGQSSPRAEAGKAAAKLDTAD